MDICGLPISFLGTGGCVNVLLTAVGVKLPSAFQVCYQALQSHTNSLELDIQSISSDVFSIIGQVKFSLSVCESPDALPFILSLEDDLLPHLGFHVIVGAAVAESQADLLQSANDFDQIVRKYSSNSVPCLFVFSSKSFDGSGLPPSATQIPSDSDQADIFRRVKEGFVRCLMEYLMGLRTLCDDICQSADDPSNLVKLASSAFLLTGTAQAAELFTMASKQKDTKGVLAVIHEQSQDSNLKFDIEKSQLEKDLPASLSDLKELELPPEVVSAIAIASHQKDNLMLVQILLRLAVKLPSLSRRLLLYVISLTAPQNSQSGKTKLSSPTSKVNPSETLTQKYDSYRKLAILLFRHLGHSRTFLFQMNEFISDEEAIPDFLLKTFVTSLTESSDWAEQRIVPASKLFSSDKVSRDVKNSLVSYLLQHLHVIRVADRQRSLLEMIPGSIEIDASKLLEIKSLDLLPITSPIEKFVHTKNNSFLFSPLTGKKKDIFVSEGDPVGLEITVYNPLSISLTFDMIEITAVNARATPAVYSIGPKRTLAMPLVINALQEGEIEVKGFTFISGKIRGVYNLPYPLLISVVEQNPRLLVMTPLRQREILIENSYETFEFEMINLSNKDVSIKALKYAPMPPVLTETSLPIKYPPVVRPPMPDILEAKSSFKFDMEVLVDKTIDTISTQIMYGSDKYVRKFEFSQTYSIIEGPTIDKIQVIPMDDRDDFRSVGLDLMVTVKNPFEYPITIECDQSSPSLAFPGSYGTIIVNVDRIDGELDFDQKTLISDEITAEHLRKCETTAIKARQRELTQEEKRQLRKTLFIKKKLQEQLNAIWSAPGGLKGELSLSHVDINHSTLVLLQTPPFTVSIDIERKDDYFWEVTCQIDSKKEIELRCGFEFEVRNTGSVINEVMTAGKKIQTVQAPTRITSFINCMPVGILIVTGKFYLEEACFVRKASFMLSE